MTDLLQDISTLTSISKLSLDKLNKLSNSIICHSIEENIIEKNPITVIDIGIGLLYIKLEDDNIKYKFTPSKTLEENVRSTLINKISPLVITIEDKLRDKIENTYKDLL